MKGTMFSDSHSWGSGAGAKGNQKKILLLDGWNQIIKNDENSSYFIDSFDHTSALIIKNLYSKNASNKHTGFENLTTWLFTKH